jgi:ribosomal protein S18 acetylase RimI-like enzyme
MDTAAATIRPATPADVIVIAALNDALIQEDSGQRDSLINREWAKLYGTAYFSDILANDTHICLVAVVQEMVVGYLAGHTYGPSDIRPVRSAELDSIYVDVAWRSRRVGELLVRAFLEWSRTRNAGWISVTSYATNERALAFYRSLGFAPYTTSFALQLA